MRISDWSSDVCSSDLIDQDRPGLEDRIRLGAIGGRRLMVDDGGDPVVRTDRQEVRRELLVLADVDREDLILHAGLFQHDGDLAAVRGAPGRSEEHTSELQSLMRISYAVFCLKKTKNTITQTKTIL